jgi:glycosyltransferase involved in cell wall biosynthesis
MGRGDRIIANSDYTAQLIAARHPAARERIRTIHRGVDAEAFEARAVPPEAVAKLKERWGVKPGTKIVLQAARLTGLKGHRDTIEAAFLLAAESALDGAVVIFAGDAPGKSAYREGLAALIARHGLDDKVRLIGHCEEMPAAFLAAEVALVPSLVPETFGRTSIEAQAMGCPVIVSDIGALPETVVAQEEDKAGSRVGW